MADVISQLRALKLAADEGEISCAGKLLLKERILKGGSVEASSPHDIHAQANTLAVDFLVGLLGTQVVEEN